MPDNKTSADELTSGHAHCRINRSEVLGSEFCGCFYCLAIFPPSEIVFWIDKREAPQQTALCPKCGIDSVIGSASGYPITADFLERMYERWFRVSKKSN
jgi:hypothetical protein